MRHEYKPFANPLVGDKFSNYPPNIRARLMDLRQLIFEVAADTPAVGELEETLKWGQPSYLPATTKSGTTIRLDQLKNTPDGYAMYFHCQTTLVDTIKEIYGGIFKLEDNRAILFDCDSKLPQAALKDCIHMALTYHLRKR